MDVIEQRKQFIELRSKGWPITKIAQSLDLPIPLLCVWLSADQVRISNLRRRVQSACEEADLGSRQSPSIFTESRPLSSGCPSPTAERMRRLPASGNLKHRCDRNHSPEQN